MSISELQKHAFSFARIIVDKLKKPETVTNIEKAELHVSELGIPHPRYFEHILYLKYKPGEYEKENTVIGMLAMLCLDYPVVFDEVLKNLECDENDSFRRSLAYNLGSVGMDIEDNSTRIDLVGKMLGDSDEMVKIFAVRGLFKFADSVPEKTNPLILKMTNDKSLNVVKESLVYLKYHPVQGSVSVLQKLYKRHDLAVFSEDIDQAIRFQSN